MKLKILAGSLVICAALGVVGAVALASSGSAPVISADQWQAASAALPAQAVTAVDRAAAVAGLSGSVQANEVSLANGSYASVLFSQGAYSAAAGDPTLGVNAVKPFASLSALPFTDNVLSILTLAQSPNTPGGSVAEIYGAGLVKAPAAAVALVLTDGTTQSVPTLPSPSGAGVRVFSFVANDPSRFPTAVRAVDADGSTLASFSFDPSSHP